MEKKRRLSKKTLYILLAAFLIIGAAVTGILLRNYGNDSAGTEEMTDIVLRQNIDTKYSANGTLAVKTQKAENAITTAEAGYRVKTVNVKVGDTVQAGDILYTLDLSDVETQQAVAKQKLANAQAQNALALKAANRDLSSAKAAQSQTQADSAAAVKAAQDAVNKAKSNLSTLQNELAEAKKAEQKAYEDLTKATAKPDDTASDQEKEPDLQAIYEAAVEKRKAAQESVSTAQESLDSANNALREANSAAKTNNRAAADDVAAKQDAVNSQNLTNQSSIAEQQEEIKKNDEVLKKGIVTASTGGTITEVNVAAGTVYAGDRAVVISDLQHLILVVEVESAHIPDIVEGMAVEFTTDTTEDEIQSGIVTFVSPVPTVDAVPAAQNGESTASASAAGDASSTAKTTHRVEVNISNPSERLRVGMKAKVDFILDRISDVLTVPTIAIQYDEDGNSYVMKQDPESMDTEKVIVDTGASNESYVEVITDELMDGDTIVYTVVSSDDEADSDALEGVYY